MLYYRVIGRNSKIMDVTNASLDVGVPWIRCPLGVVAQEILVAKPRLPEIKRLPKFTSMPKIQTNIDARVMLAIMLKQTFRHPIKRRAIGGGRNMWLSRMALRDCVIGISQDHGFNAVRHDSAGTALLKCLVRQECQSVCFTLLLTLVRCICTMRCSTIQKGRLRYG